MKKRNTALLTAALLLTTLCGTGSLSTNAQEALVLTRDSDGNVSVTIEEVEDSAVPSVEVDEDSYSSYVGGLELVGKGIVERITKGEGGQMNYHYEASNGGMYLITDGTALPIQQELDTPVNSWSIEDGTMTGERISQISIEGTELRPGDAEFPADGEQFLAAHGENARLYKIAPSYRTQLDPDVWYKIVLDNEQILDAYYGRFVHDGLCNWTGRIGLNLVYPEDIYDGQLLRDENTGTYYYKDQAAVRQAEREFMESVFGTHLLDELDTVSVKRDLWIEQFAAWRDSVDYDNMTALEREASREAAGVMSEWEMFQKGLFVAMEFEHVWKDYCLREGIDYSGRVTHMEFSSRDLVMQYGALDIWEMLGDADYNGERNAADAAEILSSAAGAAASGYPAYNSFQDINLDGEINAADAADLLIYVAGQGAGSTETMREYAGRIRG